METLTLPPVLDGPTLERFRSRLLGAVRCAEGGVVTLDASEVECITSAGLDLLVVATLLADDRSVYLRIGAASELFRRSIALTGLATHLQLNAEPALSH